MSLLGLKPPALLATISRSSSHYHLNASPLLRRSRGRNVCVVGASVSSAGLFANRACMQQPALVAVRCPWTPGAPRAHCAPPLNSCLLLLACGWLLLTQAIREPDAEEHWRARSSATRTGRMAAWPINRATKGLLYPGDDAPHAPPRSRHDRPGCDPIWPSHAHSAELIWQFHLRDLPPNTARCSTGACREPPFYGH